MNEATRHTISQELQQKHPDLSDISNCDPPLLPLLCHDCSGRSFTPCIVLMDHFMPGNSWQAESAAVEREKEKNTDLMLQISNRARLQITTDRTVWGKHRNKSRRFKSKPCSRSPSWSHIMTLSTSASFLPCSIFGATSQFNWRKSKPNTFSTVLWTCSCVTDVKKYFLSASVRFDTMVSPQSWQPMTLDQLQGLLTGCQLLPVQLSVYTEHISVVQWKQWLILPEHHTATVKVMFAESLVGSLWKGRVQRDERRLWMKYMYKKGKVSHWIRRQDNPDRYMHYLLGDFSVMETKKDNWWVKRKKEKWIQQKTVPPLNKPALDWRNSCHFSKWHCQ